MKTHHLIFTIFLGIMFSCLAVLLYIFLQIREENNSVTNNLNALHLGNTRQKIIATYFFAENKNVLAIPGLMENIDNFDTYAYKNKSHESLSCVSTLALGNIVSEKIGHTCCYSEECKEQNLRVIQRWRDWYQSEYTAWLAEQSK